MYPRYMTGFVEWALITVLVRPAMKLNGLMSNHSPTTAYSPSPSFILGLSTWTSVLHHEPTYSGTISILSESSVHSTNCAETTSSSVFIPLDFASALSNKCILAKQSHFRSFCLPLVIRNGIPDSYHFRGGQIHIL